MKRITLSVAALLAALLVPSLALADPPSEAAPAAKKARGRHSFPITATKFRELVNERLAATRARLVKRLDEKKVPAARRKAVLAAFDAHAVAIRAAAKTAGADGTVTQAEARAVRQVARKGRQAMRKQGKGERNGHKGHKGHKGKKGKRGRKGRRAHRGGNNAA